MGIWRLPLSITEINGMNLNLMAGHLGIEFTEVGQDFLTATMPVDERTIQPDGRLHGGASATLAETLGSIGAWLCIDREKKQCVGIEINANHIRGTKHGLVYGITRPLHIGKSTHVWEIKITNEEDELICVSRITVAILDKP